MKNQLKNSKSTNSASQFEGFNEDEVRGEEDHTKAEEVVEATVGLGLGVG